MSSDIPRAQKLSRRREGGNIYELEGDGSYAFSRSSKDLRAGREEVDASSLVNVAHERILESRRLESLGSRGNLTWGVGRKFFDTVSIESSSRLGRESWRRFGSRALPKILRLRRCCVILG